MTSRTAIVVAALAAGVAGFAAGRFGATAGSSGSASRGARDDAVAAEITRLSTKLDKLEELLRSMTRQRDSAARESSASAAAERTDGARTAEPAADPYVTWTDDELCLVAQAKGDDLMLFKAALRRKLPGERRAKLLLALAAFRHGLEWHCAAEREALIEATGLAPTTTVVGDEAALALAYSYSAYPDDRWRCDAYFESVLRDAPDEAHRMKGAYGLAWRHDLGDEPKEAAVTAYRDFLAKWGEKFPGTPEVNWAQHRIAVHQGEE